VARPDSSNYGLYLPQIDLVPYQRRANNQKSEEVEAMIRDLDRFAGWPRTVANKSLALGSSSEIYLLDYEKPLAWTQQDGNVKIEFPV
jgi:hypothetical protein